METLYVKNQQPLLNTDMFLTEDFLGLNNDDAESFFNSLSDEDFSGSELSSDPYNTTMQQQPVVDPNNNPTFQYKTQDPNNNILNFQYQVPAAAHPFVFLKQEEPARPQSFMIPQVMNDFTYEPASKMQKTSSVRRPEQPVSLPQFIPQQAIQLPSAAQVFAPSKPTKRKMMETFADDKLSDFKRVIYNHLVEHHNQCLLNNTTQVDSFVLPVKIEEGGKVRTGFQFNENQDPEKKLPELYAKHIRNAHLETQDRESVFVQDLYRFYLRACLELLGKYFDKRGRFTFLYDEENPLFVAGHSIAQAEVRIRSMKTRARMNKKRKSN